MAAANLDFDDPKVLAKLAAQHGDPIGTLRLEELSDLMENLWAAQSGSYAELHLRLVREGVDAWTARKELATKYFLAPLIRKNRWEGEAHRDAVEGLREYVRYLLEERIMEGQLQEARKDRARFDSSEDFIHLRDGECGRRIHPLPASHSDRPYSRSSWDS